MKLTAKRITSNDICRAAIKRFSAEDATVFPVVEPRDADGRLCYVEWFVLSVQRGGQSEIIGRRRSKAELLQLVETVEL